MHKVPALIVVIILPLVGCNMKHAGNEKDEGNEIKVAIDQVPAAVRTTLQQEAPGVNIASVDKATTGGKATYEADAVIGGQNYEIIVGEDGHVISKKLDDEADEKKGEDKEEKK